MIECFSLSFTGLTTEALICRSRHFEKVLGQFECKFGVRKRVIALSRRIKISAVHCLVLSQSTRMTDRITTLKTALA